MEFFNTLSPSTLWLIVAVVCIIIEIGVVSTLAFFFAALSAVIVGALIEFGHIDATSFVKQGGIFLGLSFVLMAILWKPLKTWKSKSKGGGYKNMVGGLATVKSPGLEKGKMGNVTWSGAPMRAKLADDAPTESYDADDSVTIVDVKGNVLIVK